MVKHEVSEVLREIDPLGLIEGGAPVDEYDLEVPDLARLVSREAVNHENVQEVFDRWFGPDILRGDMLDKLVEGLTSINITRL